MNLSISNSSTSDFKLAKSDISVNNDISTAVAFLNQILLHNLKNLINLIFFTASILFWTITHFT